MAQTVLARMAVQISANSAELVRATQQGSRSLVSLSKTAESAGQLIGTYFGARAIFGGISYGVGVLAGFEHKMQEVRAVTGSTAEQFNQLKKNATDLGAATEYTATQIAGLQAEFGRLGFRTKEILDSTKATVNLATATGSDLARVADVAGSTLRAFQLDAKEMGRVTDVMTSSFNKSALQLDTFAESMKYVAPIAKAAGISIEETTGYISVLADAGIRGSQAGTSLRRIFAELTDDGRPLSERLAELAAKGLTLADANDEVGRYAQTALLVLSSQNEKVKELTETYKNANGEARRTADLMRDDLTGDFKLLTSAIDGAIQKGTIFSDILRSITQQTTRLISSATGSRDLTNALEALAIDIGAGGQSIEFYTKILKGLRNELDSIDDVDLEKVTNGFKDQKRVLEELKKIVSDIRQENQKSRNNQGVTDIDPITGLSLNESKEALELGKKARDERAQELAKLALEEKNRQDEINKKYRERLELIQQLVKATEIQAEFEKQAARPVGSIVVPGSQTPTIGLPDKVSSPFKIIPDRLIEETEDRLKRMEDIANHIENLNNRISKSFADLGIAVLEAAGAAIGGGENFGQALLKILANFGKQYGTQLIALGVAKIAEGTAFDNPNAIRKGYGLIAAGGALVVASSALYSAVSSSRSSGGGQGSLQNINRYQGSAVSDFGNNYTFTIKGKDLVTVMEQTQADNKIRKG